MEVVCLRAFFLPYVFPSPGAGQPPGIQMKKIKVECVGGERAARRDGESFTLQAEREAGIPANAITAMTQQGQGVMNDT